MADPINVVIDLSHYNEVTSFCRHQGERHRRRDPQGDAGPRRTGPDLCVAASTRRRRRPVVGRLSFRHQCRWRGAGALLPLRRQSSARRSARARLRAERRRHHDAATSRAVRDRGVQPDRPLSGLLFGLARRQPARRRPSTRLCGNAGFGAPNMARRRCVPPTWPTWTMWQYTDGTNGDGPYQVPGIGGTGTCDRRQFNGDMDGLARLWGHGGRAAAAAALSARGRGRRFDARQTSTDNPSTRSRLTRVHRRRNDLSGSRQSRRQGENIMAKVAFLGLGVMGYPMAGHLKNKGGHELTVYNRTTAKAEAVGQGIRRQSREDARGSGRGPGLRHDVRRQRQRRARRRGCGLPENGQEHRVRRPHHCFGRSRARALREGEARRLPFHRCAGVGRTGRARRTACSP